jgi:hypothetical protein
LSNGLSDRSPSFEAGSKTSWIDLRLDEFDNRLSGLGVVGRLVGLGGDVGDKAIEFICWTNEVSIVGGATEDVDSGPGLGKRPTRLSRAADSELAAGFGSVGLVAASRDPCGVALRT